MALEKMLIEGGVPLKGEVVISGAKNAALPVLALSMLTDQTCKLSRVPQLHDVKVMLDILHVLGAEIFLKEDRLEVTTQTVEKFEAPYDYVRKMRASVLLLGPLLARFGRARVSMPGGCAIGVRPIDQHLKAFEALGATVELHEGYVEAHAQKLKGTHFRFDTITVTGTINALAVAVLAEGESVFEMCAREPEVVQCCDILNAMGADITGIGTPTLTVRGKKKLNAFDAALIADRIETGTYLVAAAITGGELFLKHARAQDLEAVIEMLEKTGARVNIEKEGLRVWGNKNIAPVHIKTTEHPGFPTDMQAQFMSLLALAKGTSVVTETIFENRFMHVPELVRMGAKLKVEGNTVVVEGVDTLVGAPVMATDLRASASLVLAGLAARGKTEVLRIYHLDRGYEKMEEKLKNVGAKIWRLPS